MTSKKKQEEKSRWLFKEEPAHYSYDDLVRDKETRWSGVKNNLALKFLRTVKEGDPIMYYHTGDEKSVVGIMKAKSDAYSTSGTELARSKDVEVLVAPVRKLSNPVALSSIKSDPRFAQFPLVRISRLSVMPVEVEIWDAILAMSA